jgi:hypothetical protein
LEEKLLLKCHRELMEPAKEELGNLILAKQEL